MFVLDALDAVAAAASLTLRFASVIFVRFHPIGKKYLSQILGGFTTYLLSAFLQLCLIRTFSTKRGHARALPALLGRVDPSKPKSSLAGCVINLLCLAAVGDFLFRGHMLHQSKSLSFSRIGYVDSNSARIVVRAPFQEYAQITATPVSAPGNAVQATIPIQEQSDYTATFVLEGLESGTEYAYRTNASHTGVFSTMADPSKASKRWSMIATSCIKPFYPYNPLDHGLRIKGLEYVDNYLSSHAAEFMLFLGDFIYIDLPVALGWDATAYATAYRQVYASPSWTPRLRNLPWLHVYDDHEIINDWAGNETGLYKTAMLPYWGYQGLANPPSDARETTHYVLQHGDISFFVLDTRRYRSDNNLPDGPDKTMLGQNQLQELLQWMGNGKEWKVVVSSVPFTRNWRGPDAADSWSGYLWERDLILDEMKKKGVSLILSGDRHEHATTLFPATIPGEQSVIEFSTSPLNQFFEPFSRHHREIEKTDISIHSHPWGTSKFGVVTFDTSKQDTLDVFYNLIVDGQETWNHTWTSHQV
ncbi:PhoD-like phosphatase [Stachybotrys elegans]|uniref:PhoD-like phosphatase n=1 Tax=Stachybotrys elegans TaxID=80388 RepID=A0A8K0SQT4_9HYPO|nr:PhoD-like phosphatase [Stachybotrys elegans]